MANKITTLLEFKEQGGGLKKISADVKAADGATGKFKAGWQGAMTTVKAYGAEAAIAIGTTLAASAIKAGQDFAAAGVEVGRFADATGLSAEEASKWVSVTDDLGVNAADMEKAFLRLNKEIGEGDGVVAEYGIELKRTADGAADVNGTMLETIKVVNGIKDPTERARVAQELFGRSYANVAEIIFDDAEKVAAALESTSEAQIFDDDEIAKAREYRAAMDQLGDVLVDLKYTVGEVVVPVLTDMANQLVDIKDAADAVPGGASGWKKAFDLANPFNWLGKYNSAMVDLGRNVGLVGEEVKKYDAELTLTAEETERSVAILNGQTAALADNAEHLRASAKEATYNADANEEMGRIQRATTDIVDKARKAQEKFLDSIKHTRDEVGKLKREIDDQQAWINYLDTFDAVNEKLANNETTTREAMSAVLELKEATIEYAESIDLPDKVVTNLIAQIDAGKAAEVQAFLERIGNGVTLPIKPQIIKTSGSSSVRVDENGNVRSVGNAGGTNFWRGGPTPVNENGPEVINLPTGTQIIPNGRTQQMTGGGGKTEVHIHGTFYGSPPDRWASELADQIDRITRGKQ